jgi:hypothetical protein
MQQQQITGKVMRTRLSPGSKSDHVGLVLRTQNGEEYVLRRMGGNAFRDETLEGLVDSVITGTGVVAGATFIISDWEVRERG